MAVFPSMVQLATALPACCATTEPPVLTVATVGSVMDQERELETTTPRESRAKQVNAAIDPSSSVAVEGEI